MALALPSLLKPHSVDVFLSHTTTRQTCHSAATFTFDGGSFLEPNHLRALLMAASVRAATHHVAQCNCFKSPKNVLSKAGRLHSVFREIGFHDEAVNSLLLNNPSLGLTSLDKIRSRLLSLRTLRLDSVALHRLIAECPDILVAEEVEPVIRFLLQDLEGNLEPQLVERLLTATDARFLAGFDHKVKLLLHSGVPKEKIAYFLNSVNLIKFLRRKSIEDVERIVDIFQRFGGIDILVRRPAILNCELYSQLIPRTNFIWELSGKDDIATGAVIRRLPAILTYSVKHMEDHVDFLKNFAGLRHQQIFKIVLVFPNVISTSKERKLHPRLEFLKQCGLDSGDIFKFLTKAPLFLALSEDNLAQKLGFVVKIGYEHRTKEFAMAVGAVTRTSCENLQKVIGVFLSYGLSVSDIQVMSKKHPQVLQYNHSSLQEKLEYLIDKMGREVRELLAFPAFLGYKLDARIKQRYEVKKVKDKNMSLNKLLTLSAEKFSVNKKL